MKGRPRVGYFLLGTSLLLLTRTLVAADVADDPVKQQILAQAHSVGPNDYNFTRTSRIEEIGIGKTEKRVIVERWDSSKNPEQRWSLVSVDGHAPEANDAKAYVKANSTRKVPSYSRLAEYFGNAERSASSTPGQILYRIGSLPKGTVVIAGSDLSSVTSGEATVNASASVPFVEQLRFTMEKPTRIKLLANLARFENVTRYRIMPDGHPFPAQQTIEMNGSMLGKEGRIHTTVSYSEVTAVPH